MVKTITVDSQPRTDREVDIQQVVGIITKNWASGYGASNLEEYVQKVNNSSGWYYDCRYPSKRYVRDTGYTRVKGRSLSEEDLAIVVVLARNILDMP